MFTLKTQLFRPLEPPLHAANALGAGFLSTPAPYFLSPSEGTFRAASKVLYHPAQLDDLPASRIAQLALVLKKLLQPLTYCLRRGFRQGA